MHATLFSPGTTVAPGGFVFSQQVDVEGFQTVSVNVSTISPTSNLVRDISFSNPFDAGYRVVYRDTFPPLNHLFRAVPVHAPRLLVVVTNNGSINMTIEGFVYATR